MQLVGVFGFAAILGSGVNGMTKAMSDTFNGLTDVSQAISSLQMSLRTR